MPGLVGVTRPLHGTGIHGRQTVLQVADLVLQIADGSLKVREPDLLVVRIALVDDASVLIKDRGHVSTVVRQAARPLSGGAERRWLG